MQLTNIITITADLELLTGLRIGGGDTEMHIGGVDNSIIKHPITQEPYLPGSSIKGKMRSLLEWRSGAVKAAPLSWHDYQQASTTQQSHVLHILQLFGLGGADDLTVEQAKEVGPSRLSFWDCSLNADWVQAVKEDNLPLTEVKSENRINRIAGTAEHPRQTERIPAGAKFDFRLSIKQLAGDDEKLTDTLLAGLKLLELDSLGGSGSRGYGKIKFVNLKINGEDISAKFEQVQPFNMS
jgi:CRISPR-associated protein Csm3